MIIHYDTETVNECLVYYVCEKCGESFIVELNEIKEMRKTLQCPFCGAMAAFLCRDPKNAAVAIEAVKMRNNVSARINRMKGGDFS